MSFRGLLLVAVLGGCGSVAGDPCPGGTDCNGICVDLQHDQTNCGTCGNACVDRKTCTAGTCALGAACPGGLTDCSGTCEALDVDPDHCGSCTTSCGPGGVCSAGACDARVWQGLVPLPHNAAFSDFTPTGQLKLFNVDALFADAFAFPDGANPMGVVTALAPPPTTIVDLTSSAWIGDALLVVNATSVYAYSISGNTWTTPVAATLAHAAGQTQTTGDDSGFVYALATDKTLLQVKVAGSTVVNVAGPAALTTVKPRLAWDSESKQVYIGDVGDTTGAFRAFDPMTSTFVDRKPFPPMVGFGPAFCSDRKGHVFAVDNEITYSSTVWMYTASADSWQQIASLPFSHGAISSCTTTADGFIYFAGNNVALARLEL